MRFDLNSVARSPNQISRMTKFCTRCNTVKPASDYSWRNREKGTLFTWCKKCRKEYDRERQATQDYRETKKLRQTEVRLRNRQLIYNYLKEHPCACGEARIPCLQFDHDDNVEKLGVIAIMISSASVNTLLQEIAKCTVRCANCHAARTAEQQGWYSTLFT